MATIMMGETGNPITVSLPAALLHNRLESERERLYSKKLLPQRKRLRTKFYSSEFSSLPFRRAEEGKLCGVDAAGWIGRRKFEKPNLPGGAPL